MIGQNKLLSIISSQVECDEFPRFSIIVGPDGSGKKTLTTAIAFALECQKVFIEPKVDAVREMISNAYKVKTNTMYVILDGIMSPSAKNALLKICEETPENAYICMLTSDENTILDTLRSRASMYYMQPYTSQEILEYTKSTKKLTAGTEYIITDLCETPGDVDKLYNVGVEDFYKFVEKVVNNIAEVSSANALKITDSIDTKGTNADKYDMTLFLRAFKSICGKRLKQNIAENGDIVEREHYSGGIKVASNSLSQLNIVGINKGALFDIFILNIRREWA